MSRPDNFDVTRARWAVDAASKWAAAGSRLAQARDLKPGDVIASHRAAWRVDHVEQVSSTREPSGLGPVRVRQLRIDVIWLAGQRVPALGESGEGGWTVSDYTQIPVYERGRWFLCSCCGELAPCRADAADVIAAASEIIDTHHEAKVPGACWRCQEPITARQRAVAYPGINLDSPLQPAPRFHLRRACRRAAEDYERRWNAADDRRPRILTWPRCNGRLVVHADGTAECHQGLDDCWGHPEGMPPAYEHVAFTACQAQSHGCGRECTGPPPWRSPAPPMPERDIRAMEAQAAALPEATA